MAVRTRRPTAASVQRALAGMQLDALGQLLADEQFFAAVTQGVLRPQVSDVLPKSSFADGLQRLARR